VIGQIPARERVILRMRFVEDLTQTEIGARVGISQMQVSRLLHRSLEQLRDLTGGPMAARSQSTTRGGPVAAANVLIPNAEVAA
jgi:DNA-directed RNA polymerase specialized sigma24 family protein